MNNTTDIEQHSGNQNAHAESDHPPVANGARAQRRTTNQTNPTNTGRETQRTR